MRRLTLLLILALTPPASAQVYLTPGTPSPILPTSMTVERGTLTAGNLAAVLSRDNTLLQVTELGTTDPLRVRFTFTGVATPINGLTFFGRYEGNPAHEVHIEIYHPGLDAWDPLYPEVISDPENRWHTYHLNSTGYISNTGVVEIRLRHVTSGSASHNVYLDAIAILH